MEFKLSTSSLNLFQECPRSFWLYFGKKIKKVNKWFKENSQIEYLFIIYRRNKNDNGLEWRAFVLDSNGKCIYRDIIN